MIDWEQKQKRLLINNLNEETANKSDEYRTNYEHSILVKLFD